MSPLESKRTLVKSPPELWAEVSDAGALARHLGELGKIRITRAQPESVVEWEGERVSGRVHLEPSGWGTRVTLTAEPVAEPEAQPQPDAQAQPEPEPVAEPEPEPAQPQPGFFARLLSRWRAVPPPESQPENVGEPEPESNAESEPQSGSDPHPTREHQPVSEPQRDPEPASSLDEERTLAVLTGVLDALGAAHHRPFSRP